jgi:hypothetical protein
LEAVLPNAGRDGFRRYAPDTIIAPGQFQRLLGPLAAERNLFGLGGANAERDPPIGQNLR